MQCARLYIGGVSVLLRIGEVYIQTHYRSLVFVFLFVVGCTGEGMCE